MADPAKVEDQNLLPVQAYFSVDGTFQTFIGQGQPFYASLNPDQSGLHITNSTIDSSTIGATTPSTGVFTNVSATTGQVSSAPVGSTDLVNKQYVDSFTAGISFKEPAAYGTTGNITLSGLATQSGGDWGSSLTGGMRILVKNQTAQAENGVYVAASGAWSRSSDCNTWDELVSALIFVTYGNTLAGSAWYCPIQAGGTLGVTAITWSNFAVSAVYSAGTGLNLSSYQFSIANTGVTAATYGSASKTLTATVNAQGQLTALSAGDIAIAGTQITSGLVSPTYGGTGVNNGSNTLTWNASYTLNQSVASGASPSFVGTNFSSIPNAALSNSSVTINGTTVALGASGTITAANPYALTLGTGLSGTSYNGSSAVTAAIANTGVSANSYTYANFTVNAQGQLTAASSNSTTGSGSIVLAAAPTVSGEWASLDSLSFNTAATPTSAVGKIFWDGGTTLNLGMTSTVTQKIGEDQFYYVKASSAITRGEVVMFTGSVGASGVITAAPATGVTDGSYIVGIAAESISLNGFGLIQSFGVLRNINTTGYADGDILWYNPAVTGGLTKTKPSAPNVKVQMAAVLNGGSSGGGSIQIRIDSGSVLGGTDSNVQFGNLANGNAIIYNSTAGYWENVAQSTLAVGTATNLAGGGAGYVPYQSASGTTLFVSAGTSGQVLTSNGTSAPTWTSPVAYATVTDDTTTNATRYPLFANQTTGNLSTEYVSSTKFQFNPSTGVLTSTSFSGAGTGLTGTASSLSIGGTAANITATSNSSLTTLSALSLPGSQVSSAVANATNATNIGITDDTSSNTTVYPTWVTTTTGNLPAKTTSSKLKFNPSTGALTASQLIIAP